LKSLEKEDLEELLNRAISTDLELKEKTYDLQETEAMFRYSGGDARKLLNIIELVTNAANSSSVTITNKRVEEILQENIALYDKQGEMHYDIISAFIKSIRGGDPNGAVYWLARMLEGGEDIKFIARRLVILAAEDIGLANPNALLTANPCFEGIHKIGMPEARIILSACCIYLPTSPKSNSAYEAIGAAISQVRELGDLPVPPHLPN